MINVRDDIWIKNFEKIEVVSEEVEGFYKTITKYKINFYIQKDWIESSELFENKNEAMRILKDILAMGKHFSSKST